MLKDKIINPLDYFNYENNSGGIYKKLKERLFELLPKWEDLRRTRWKNRKSIPIPQRKLRIRPYTRIYQTIRL